MELMFAEGSQPWFSFEVPPGVYNTLQFLKVLIGFSIIIFVHELGHFTAAKWVGVRVDRFAIGLGTRLFGWRKGEGFTFGNRPNYTAEEVAAKGYGETDYCFKALPIGGYVKMLGQDDIQIDEKSGEVTMTNDPRAFTNRTVGQRALIVSAGVIMNLVFAALAFMAVFLAGIKLEAPVIGYVDPDGPAAKAGMKPGDRVLRINGGEVIAFREINAAQVLSDGAMVFEVDRDGERHHLTVTPERDERRKLSLIGVEQLFSTELQREGDPVEGYPNLRAGDVIVEVNRVPVKTAIDVGFAFRRSRGGFAEVVAERVEKGEKKRMETRQRALLNLVPPDPPGSGMSRVDGHILGARPRLAIALVQPGEPAEQAGFKAGDVVAQWDSLAAPSYGEITESIQGKPGKPIRAVVERGGKTVELTVIPQRPFSFFGTELPRVGLSFGRIETEKPVVAGVAPGTPMAELGVPRESVITAIDGREMNTWHDVVDTLKDSAGKTVQLTYRTGGDIVTGALKVPSSLVDQLGLAPDVHVLSVNGEKEAQITIVDQDGKRREEANPLPNISALRALLHKNIGRTVTIKYVTPDGGILEKPFAVTAENFDPWQARVNYDYDATQRFGVLKELVDADGNPLKAVQLGMKITGGTILQIYQTMKAMAGRSVSVEHVSGPIGIFSYAIGVAKEGLIELTFFLAFLSVNLAVINFLPLPVVDGGLMVFLIIEKIKGKPLSLKTQMVSTIVGLALIVLCFLFVTIQDITKLF